MKNSRSELFSTRRSTVKILTLQQGFLVKIKHKLICLERH